MKGYLNKSKVQNLWKNSWKLIILVPPLHYFWGCVMGLSLPSAGVDWRGPLDPTHAIPTWLISLTTGCLARASCHLQGGTDCIKLDFENGARVDFFRLRYQPEHAFFPSSATYVLCVLYILTSLIFTSSFVRKEFWDPSPRTVVNINYDHNKKRLAQCLLFKIKDVVFPVFPSCLSLSPIFFFASFLLSFFYFLFIYIEPYILSHLVS